MGLFSDNLDYKGLDALCIKVKRTVGDGVTIELPLYVDARVSYVTFPNAKDVMIEDSSVKDLKKSGRLAGAIKPIFERYLTEEVNAHPEYAEEIFPNDFFGEPQLDFSEKLAKDIIDSRLFKEALTNIDDPEGFEDVKFEKIYGMAPVGFKIWTVTSGLSMPYDYSEEVKAASIFELVFDHENAFEISLPNVICYNGSEPPYIKVGLKVECTLANRGITIDGSPVVERIADGSINGYLKPQIQNILTGKFIDFVSTSTFGTFDNFVTCIQTQFKKYIDKSTVDNAVWTLNDSGIDINNIEMLSVTLCPIEDFQGDFANLFQTVIRKEYIVRNNFMFYQVPTVENPDQEMAAIVRIYLTMWIASSKLINENGDIAELEKLFDNRPNLQIAIKNFVNASGNSSDVSRMLDEILSNLNPQNVNFILPLSFETDIKTNSNWRLIEYHEHDIKKFQDEWDKYVSEQRASAEKNINDELKKRRLEYEELKQKCEDVRQELARRIQNKESLEKTLSENRAVVEQYKLFPRQIEELNNSIKTEESKIYCLDEEKKASTKELENLQEKDSLHDTIISIIDQVSKAI